MKFAWIMAEGNVWDKKKQFITTALESGMDHVVDFSDADNIRRLGNVKLISDIDGSDVMLVGRNSEGDGTLIIPDDLSESKDLAAVKRLKRMDKKVAAYVEILTKKHQELAALLGKEADYLILMGRDWKVIPLENLIAGLQDEDVKIIAAVADYDEAKVALETMEHGTDGILLCPHEISHIKKVSELIDKIKSESYQLKPATVTKVEPVGIGDRVCVDTCSMMQLGEGMLVGSYSQGLFLVHSESMESEYVASRPFRVNAGPVHAYVMTPGNKTKYLSELETGDEVLTVDQEGNSKVAIVGRVKIEKRPLMLVEAESDGVILRTLLQNAETIRLVAEDGTPLSVAELKVGDKVMIYLDPKARHFGMAIEETIIEK
ncbi:MULTISPECIES: 3-dehydroquinate synthase II [Methanobacterium]|jgi:3-dehydroquinate synthase II|uniref:3-dehydroquinate synthase n=1 Tax=Methanobacterium formicicum TaxID=2162 RepID=A0A090JXJ6_METFO|nr:MULTISPECIES: 3-dehydroquinate synthase II [Methanobacterium]AIS32088.1 3-dehydroquinate synthase AroB [Methanobacterium formicicum]KUK71967.1 MAG: 3-dehydroquinate synthase [Methanobacterium sp. 42_16]MBF4474581.1 3-dehydroquinate synthase II [Methanobacterium formicicum]MDD4811346.1 3-dehydroquinate synthase II [Methanobacterium formicicum]MDG3547375.1 3-dehydroquinate synthase II [Methanobacterium formicicum]